jgi:hypothetical protein
MDLSTTCADAAATYTIDLFGALKWSRAVSAQALYVTDDS